MRKFLSVLPPFLLVLFLTLPASAAGTALRIHAPPPPVRAGETFTVRVDVEDSPGLTSVQFTLAFDKARMTCTGVTAGPLLADALSQTNPDGHNGASLASASAETIGGDGTLAEFAFRAEEDLSAFPFRLEGALLWDGQGRSVPVAVMGTEADGTGGSRDAEPPAQDPAPARDPVPEQPRTSGGASGGSSGRTVTPAPAEDPAPALEPIPASDALPPAVPETEPAAEPASPQTAEQGGSVPETRSAPSFTDTAGHWAEAQIAEAAARGLFGGYADGTFRPDLPLTRAQYVAVLWKLSGRPAGEGAVPFTDLDGVSAEFRSAIAWAYRSGFISGTSAAAFSPCLPVTRQAAMKILFAFNGGQSGAEALFAGVYDGTYADSGSISAWARPGVYWAVYHDILRGTAPATLNPAGSVTRAQTAVLMVRYTDRFPPQNNG